MEMVDRDKRLILNDRGIHLIAELASECGISNRNVCNLGMSKISALWVPRNPNMQDRQKKGVESRFSGSVQCQSRIILHGTQVLKKSQCNGSAQSHPT